MYVCVYFIIFFFAGVQFPPLPQSSRLLSPLILDFFLSQQNAPDYAPCYQSHPGACLEAVISLRWGFLGGSVRPIRDCCSVNSPLTSSGWLWLRFSRVSFVLSRLLHP